MSSLRRPSASSLAAVVWYGPGSCSCHARAGRLRRRGHPVVDPWLGRGALDCPVRPGGRFPGVSRSSSMLYPWPRRRPVLLLPGVGAREPSGSMWRSASCSPPCLLAAALPRSRRVANGVRQSCGQLFSTAAQEHTPCDVLSRFGLQLTRRALAWAQQHAGLDVPTRCPPTAATTRISRLPRPLMILSNLFVLLAFGLLGTCSTLLGVALYPAGALPEAEPRRDRSLFADEHGDPVVRAGARRGSWL